MTEASRVQKMLNEQNVEIDNLKNRIEQLEAALWKIVVREHQAEIVSKLATELADIARIVLDQQNKSLQIKLGMQF